ncbi:MAG: hypothetical protein K0V04_15960 [Deltaproteobacteria bacterium]|nr:hypothetical protein [Deltaproteobacteria bacterium]
MTNPSITLTTTQLTTGTGNADGWRAEGFESVGREGSNYRLTVRSTATTIDIVNDSRQRAWYKLGDGTWVSFTGWDNPNRRPGASGDFDAPASSVDLKVELKGGATEPVFATLTLTKGPGGGG